MKYRNPHFGCPRIAQQMLMRSASRSTRTSCVASSLSTSDLPSEPRVHPGSRSWAT
jgi:hypothetical protein